MEYGSIENAYAHVGEIKPPRASKALQEHYDLAKLSKVLATINVDADFSYNLEDAKIGAAARCGWQGLNRDTILKEAEYIGKTAEEVLAGK